MTYLKGFFHRERLLNAVERSTLYFGLSVIWLALLVAGLAFALLE